MRRGDVVELRLPGGVGSEQRGKRLGVVVQSDVLLPRSVVLVAPTSTAARAASFRPTIEVRGETTRVMVEQVRALSVERLGRRVAGLAPDEQWLVDEALTVVLGLL
ncbi:MAG: type II toxin-antitoxin system PemK/MazF family toxin [Actinomycetes bacterium]